MKTTGKPNTPSTGSPQSYERLLSAAQAAQSAADRAVADLAAIKRTLSEAPRVTQMRREELAKAQQALERAENELATAREQVAGKQAEAARLIEGAADAQRLLAQALINQDIMPESQMAEVVQSRKPAALPPSRPQPAAASPAFDPTLGTNRYTPMPSMHPADLHAEVMEYLRDRDALCPSCGHSLRGIDTARCPGCRLQLSVNVLKSVRAHWMTATPAIWAIRILAFVAVGLTLHLSTAKYKPFGCGLGYDCHWVFQSAWSKIAGIPVGFFALPVFLGILLSTGFIHIGLTDQTRRKAWSVMAALSMLAGVAGLWFIIVQAVFLRAVCPHCLAVDLIGIVLAVLVLKRGPLGKPEILPERAAGQITIPGGSALSLAFAAVITVALLAGIQVVHWNSAPPSRENDRAMFGPQKQVDQGNGLLMKPLDIDVEAEKEKEKEKPIKVPSYTEPPKPKGDPEFIFPADPKKNLDGKQPDKPGTPGTDAKEVNDEKKSEKDGSNAKPADDLKLDLTPPKPASPDAEASASDAENDGKAKDKFDFAPTIDPAKK